MLSFLSGLLVLFGLLFSIPVSTLYNYNIHIKFCKWSTNYATLAEDCSIFALSHLWARSSCSSHSCSLWSTYGVDWTRTRASTLRSCNVGRATFRSSSSPSTSRSPAVGVFRSRPPGNWRQLETHAMLKFSFLAVRSIIEHKFRFETVRKANSYFHAARDTQHAARSSGHSTHVKWLAKLKLVGACCVLRGSMDWVESPETSRNWLG